VGVFSFARYDPDYYGERRRKKLLCVKGRLEPLFPFSRFGFSGGFGLPVWEKQKVKDRQVYRGRERLWTGGGSHRRGEAEVNPLPDFLQRSSARLADRKVLRPSLEDRTDDQRPQTAVRIGRLPGPHPPGHPVPCDLGSFKLLHFNTPQNPAVDKR